MSVSVKKFYWNKGPLICVYVLPKTAFPEPQQSGVPLAELPAQQTYSPSRSLQKKFAIPCSGVPNQKRMTLQHATLHL